MPGKTADGSFEIDGYLLALGVEFCGIGVESITLAAEVSHGPGKIVYPDGNMAVGGQVRGFHDLNGAGKNGTAALFNREAEHAAQKAGGFAGLTVILAVEDVYKRQGLLSLL